MVSHLQNGILQVQDLSLVKLFYGLPVVFLAKNTQDIYWQYIKVVLW